MKHRDDAAPAITGATLDSKIFESSPDCLILLDSEGRIVAINKNGHCAMEIDDDCTVIGKPWKFFWPKESHPELETALAAAFNGEMGHFRGCCPTVKGRPTWWDVTVTPLCGVKGSITSLLVISRDTTNAYQAKRKLEESEARFHSLIKATAAIAWNGPASGQFETEQESWAAFTGQTFEEYRGWGWLNAVHPDDRDGSAASWKQASEAGTHYQHAHRLRRADGQYRHMSVRAVPLVDSNGAIYEWVGLHTDITENVLASSEEERLIKELQAANKRMADIFRQAPAFICALRGPDHRFELTNDRYLQLIGHRDVVGQAVRLALPEVEGQGFFELLDQVYQSGKTFTGTDMPVLLQRSPDKPLEKRFIDLVYIALRDAEGAITGILVHGVDQTERKQAETVLSEREEQLRLALDAADVGQWDINVGSEHMFWPARVKAMFGISPDNPVTLFDYYNGVHPDDREHTLSSFANTADPNLRTQYDAEYRTIGKEDQVVRWVAAKGRGIFNESNQCIRIIGTAIDITRRKASDEALRESEERLRESDRRKDEFLAMLAHELRNPLAPIGAAAQLLQMVKLDEAQVRQTSQIIDRQVTHMTSLVDDLLDVSRVTRGLIDLDNATLDISHVVADAVEQVTPLIRTRRHHLGLQMTPEAPLVMGDKKRLVQVIVNLLNNAAKYTHEGGQLLLKTEVRSEQVLIQITDNGIGMAPELLSRAFDLFAQAERTSDRTSGGLGLGLALVKSLVELHHGTVSCESAGLGQGSTFTVCLPRVLVEERLNDQRAPNPSSHKSSAALRILVVDDNVDAASILSMLLEAGGHEVFIEYGSHSALERAKVEAPQVCLLDIGLPEMDGNELAQRLRALPQTARSVLVAVTGYGQDSDREQSLAAGFDHHLVKPVDTKKLSTILASIDNA